MHFNPHSRWVDDNATADERTFSTLIHLSLLAHLVIPYLAILVPIFLWLAKKKESTYIADHGREAVNFQISLAIYSVILPLIAIPIGLLLFIIGVAVTVPIAAAFAYVLGLVGMILAAVAANRGELFRYPMTIRFLRTR